MNKKLVLYPEVIASVLKNKEEDVFTIWLISKVIDISNNGLVKQDELLNIAKLVLGLSSTYTYEKIKKGINKYWRKPEGKNGNKLIGLISINKIISRLQPEITRVQPVVINLQYFKSEGLNTKFLRNLYISIVAGRYSDNRPLAIETISTNTGLSERSIQSAIKNSQFISVHNNFMLVKEYKNYISLITDIDKYKYNASFKIEQIGSSFKVLKQIGNSYTLLDFDRLPLRTRPKSLKYNDKLMLDKLSQSRYHCNGKDYYSDNNKIISIKT